MTIEVDLFRDFAEQVRTKLSIDPAIDQSEVMRMFAWSYLRRLPQQKWKVHYSKELQQNPFFISNRQYIDKIRDEAESGEDLAIHASTLIENIQGRDDMLADWGIYHLHPGHGTRRAKTTGFVNRGGELLFVFPNGDDLYFLDVLNHGSWTNFSLIGVIDNNWPSTIDRYRLKDVIELAYEPTEEQLYELRKMQVNASFRVGSNFFMGPGLGLVTDGASTRAVMMALSIKKLLDNYSDQLRKEGVDLRRALEEKIAHSLPFASLSLELVEYDLKNGIAKIVETNSDTVFTFSK